MSNLPPLSKYIQVIKEKKDLPLPIYSVTLSNGMQPRETLGRSVLSELESKDNLFAAKGDICYNMMRMWQGASGLVPEDCHVSPAYVVCRPKENLDPIYAAYMLKSQEAIKAFIDRSQGVTSDRWRLYPDEFLKVSLFIPPLPEQKKIAEILSGIDQSIQCLQKAIECYRKARNALMESIFLDGYQKAKSGAGEWRVWTIEELLADTPAPMRSGPFGSALLKEELVKKGIPFLGIDNVRTEEFVPTFKRFLTNEKFSELRRYEVFPRDVMITIMGTVGRSCIVPEGTGKCVSSKHTWTMTLDRNKVAPEIVCWQLNHFSKTRKKFLESSQGGVMDAISSQTLRETEVPIPANKEYSEKIAGQYQSSHRYQQVLEAKLEKSRLLKNAITSDLLSGRKRVSV